MKANPEQTDEKPVVNFTILNNVENYIETSGKFRIDCSSFQIPGRDSGSAAAIYTPYCDKQRFSFGSTLDDYRGNGVFTPPETGKPWHRIDFELFRQFFHDIHCPPRCPGYSKRNTGMGDDFPEAVKRILASRVGNLCSNPKCRALTSGPQVDPTKALNVGVAAHITAASPGGPRYDASLSPEERSGHENGIWLCQTDAKLVDNDPARFTVVVLKQWKRDAEQEAFDRIGRTQVETPTPAELKPGKRVMIRPIIPRNFESEQFVVKEVTRDVFKVEKPLSGHDIVIPRSAVEKVQSWGDFQPPWIMLAGRLQWRTRSRTWVYLPEQPPFGPVGQYGSWKTVWMFGLGTDIAEAIRSMESKWVLEQNLPRCLSEGWRIFYDEDGCYLRSSDRPNGQILIVKHRV